jgi:hypothetical protein
VDEVRSEVHSVYKEWTGRHGRNGSGGVRLPGIAAGCAWRRTCSGDPALCPAGREMAAYIVDG